VEITQLRVIHDAPAAGSWNMAVDEMMFSTVEQRSIPILRLYGWQEPTLSLGYFQSHTERAQHAASRECAWVRRSTGGGAIVHDHELTYSIALPLQARWSSFAESIYDWFHDALVECLASFGLQAQRCEQTLHPLTPEPFLCFQRRARGDVLLGEHKIGGSAQRRKQGALLQHGSILWSQSAYAPELLGIGDLQKSSLTFEKFTQSFLQSVHHKKGFLSPFEFDQWRSDELKVASTIENELYLSDTWNLRR
jgi:lipoate-protein ligase A